MSQLHIEADGVTKAPPEVVWSLIGDANAYSVWGPWDASGYGDPNDKSTNEVGPIRWYRSGRTTTVERVTEIDSGRRMVYTVVKGIPVRNYRAEVTLTPSGGGTRIHWAATWDKTLVGRLVQRALRKFYPKVLSQLVIAADECAPSHPQGGGLMQRD
jgi:hypothetical protein